MSRINRKQRRGLSSVVGAVFMVLIMIGALNAILLTLRQQDTITQAVIDKSNSNLNKLNEAIGISDIRVSGNKLNMTISNAGGAAATLKSIYIVNETANKQYRYDLNIPVDGRNIVKNIGQSLPITLKNNTKYSVKLVTETGNTAATTITPLSSVALPMSLYLVPPTLTPNENITVLYAVSNNLTDGSLGRNISLNLNYTLSCTAGPTCSITKYVQPPSNTTFLSRGSMMLFKWVFKVNAPDMTYVTFNASLLNAKLGNYAIEKGYVKLVESAQTSFSSEIIINSGLVQKPEIFTIVPSPFGDSSDKGLWGVIVANPTTTPMNVSRVVISAYTAETTGGGSTEMLNSGCSVTAVFPATTWSCPHANMLEWKDTINNQVIPGLEARSFLAKVQPGNPTLEPAFMISVAVFTSMGQFTKTGDSGGIRDVSESLANVYLTDAAGTAIRGNQTINAAQSVTLYVAMADLDTSTSTYVKSGTRLIINVPKGFTGVTVPGGQTGFTTSVPIQYSDGSTQIVATLNQNLGDTSAEIKVLQFTVTAPAAPSPPAKRIYIMHTLIDGETASGFSAGAFAEIVLVVKP